MRKARARISVSLLAGAVALVGCAGPASTLRTVHPATGHGPVRFELENKSDVPINNFYLAPSGRVRAAGPASREPGSPAQQALWGPDLLARSALEVGGRVPVPVPHPGRYDARAVDRQGREQHIGSLRLGAGGRYVLELKRGSWRLMH